MALQGDNLLVHADAMVYVNHGISIAAVNESFHRLMLSPDVDQRLRTLEAFMEHMALSSLALTGGQRVEQLLKLYVGKLLVHGHTPSQSHVALTRFRSPAPECTRMNVG